MPADRFDFRRAVTDPVVWIELFLVANLGFLAVDIYVAHSMNAFGHWAEWIPLVFSCAAPVLLIAGWILTGGIRPLISRFENGLNARQRCGRWLALLVGWVSIVIGIAGLIYHLQSHFFHEQTLKSLVYAAPFVAPLAYTGLGLLVLLNQMVSARSRDWALWVILLAWGGFIGNFLLSVVDHAQNGFFDHREWIPVVTAAFAVGTLLAAILDYDNRPFLWIAQVVMLIQIVVGILGWYFHMLAIAASPMDTWWEAVVFSAPVFAPLLFANLAVLGMIGLWALQHAPVGLEDALHDQRAASATSTGD